MARGHYSGSVLDGKYEVGELLGEGGMGSVYRGEHRLIGRPVAIKLLHESLLGHEEAVKRFYREGEAAAAISHRNIIDVMDVGVCPEGEPYMVLELLEGEGLEDLLEREGRLDPAAAAAILEQVLDALAAAHASGIVHRDLKPENVFLEQQSGGDPTVKLIDFGISKLRDERARTQLTADGSLLGTPAYMAPEQIRSAGEVDARADLYAAGVIFYEMLTGARPYDGEHFSEILSNVLTCQPRPACELREDLPAPLLELLDRVLAKDPDERFSSAAELREALRAAVPADDRQQQLTVLGGRLEAGSFAGGDLGAEPGDSTQLASEVLEQVVEERRGSRRWLRPARRLARRVWNERGLRLRAAGIGAGVLLAVALLAALCGSGGGVSLELEGVPKKARVYYDDSLVSINPLRVEADDSIHPLRIEAPGYETFRFSVLPDRDKTVRVRLVRKGASKRKSPRVETEPAEKKTDPGAGKEPSRKKKPASSGKQPRKKSKGKKLIDKLKKIKPPWKD
ncbi:MAG: serine/threonine-protein kinase [Polyangia bacterium]